VRHQTNIEEECAPQAFFHPTFLHAYSLGAASLFPCLCRWFGIVLLPLVSFSADGAVAVVFFIRSSLRYFFGTPPPPDTIAEGRAIDLSIQFILFWMPFVTLLGWWLNKPVSLLFGKEKNRQFVPLIKP
jgi:Ca2+/H+ antiporter